MGWFKRLIGKEARSGVHAGIHPRDPALAEYFGVLSATASGVNVTPANALSCPAVAACIGLLSDTVGTVPLDLFERTGENSQQRAVGHPLHTLLHDTPNSYQTSAEFRQEMMTHLCTYNNAYARIVVNGAGMPIALEPMHPSQVGVFKFLSKSGHYYRFQPTDGRPTETLLPDEVLHLRRRPFSKDGLTGESAVYRHRDTIGLAMAANQYLARFFANNAMPKKGIKIPGSVSDKSVETLRESWEAKHQGVENAHRLAIFHSGMEPVDLGMNHNDAQIVELYRAQVAEIARIWGVPLHLIGETDKSTSWGTGIEQQSIGFIMYFVRPWYVTWEQALNRALLTPSMRGKYFFEFNADGLLRGDFKTRIEGYVLMVQWGLATPNEVRRLMNLPPIEGGDSRLQPLNYAPAEKVMDILLKPSDKAQRALEDVTRVEK